MRTAAVTVVAAAALAVAVGAGATTRAALRLVTTQPAVVVRGTHFHPVERVRVSLAYSGTVTTRRMRTTSAGTFTVSLGTLAGFDPCSDMFNVLAIGAAGEHVSIKFVPRECPPPP